MVTMVTMMTKRGARGRAAARVRGRAAQHGVGVQVRRGRRGRHLDPRGRGARHPSRPRLPRMASTTGSTSPLACSAPHQMDRHHPLFCSSRNNETTPPPMPAPRRGAHQPQSVAQRRRRERRARRGRAGRLRGEAWSRFFLTMAVSSPPRFATKESDGRLALLRGVVADRPRRAPARRSRRTTRTGSTAPRCAPSCARRRGGTRACRTRATARCSSRRPSGTRRATMRATIMPRVRRIRHLARRARRGRRSLSIASGGRIARSPPGTPHHEPLAQRNWRVARPALARDGPARIHAPRVREAADQRHTTLRAARGDRVCGCRERRADPMTPACLGVQTRRLAAPGSHRHLPGSPSFSHTAARPAMRPAEARYGGRLATQL